MTLTVRPGPFNPSPALFRQAVTSAKEATQWAAARAQGRAVQGVPNLGQREMDACVITVLFSHAAIECEWHWRHVDSGTPLQAHWPTEFDRGLTDIAAKLGLPDPGSSDAELAAQLFRLGTWRNFFQHGDKRARERLGNDGLSIDDLDAGYAAAVIAQADVVFARIASATGGQLVGPSSSLWTGFPMTDA